MRYYLLATNERPSQRVPFGVNPSGELVKLCGCPIELITSDKRGDFYVAQLNRDLAQSSMYEPRQNRQVVIRLSPLLGISSIKLSPITPLGSKAKIKKITKGKYEEIHEARHLMIAADFAASVNYRQR